MVYSINKDVMISWTKADYDYDAVDFTLEELKSLRVRQRYKFRDPQYNG